MLGDGGFLCKFVGDFDGARVRVRTFADRSNPGSGRGRLTG